MFAFSTNALISLISFSSILTIDFLKNMLINDEITLTNIESEVPENDIVNSVFLPTSESAIFVEYIAPQFSAHVQ